MTKRCANCGIEIHWTPTAINGVSYCCLGCSEGGPCTCDYSRLPQDSDKAALVCRQFHYSQLLKIEIKLVKK